MSKSVSVLSLFILGLIYISTRAQDINSLRKLHFNTEKLIAIQGYDPVSYFQEGKPRKGDKQFAYSYGNITYFFSSKANLETFKKNPMAYEPQFGGWCAYAMGKTGDKVEVDPKTFKIIGGKLYLFYHTLFNNTLDAWNQNETFLLTKANANWKKIYK